MSDPAISILPDLDPDSVDDAAPVRARRSHPPFAPGPDSLARALSLHGLLLFGETSTVAAGVENAEAPGEILRSHERSTRARHVRQTPRGRCLRMRRAVTSSTLWPPMERDEPSGTLLVNPSVLIPTLCPPMRRDAISVTILNWAAHTLTLSCYAA
ncbi:hypothetical protein FB451DRAFT_1395932 [Mycena latifolia]|nr:hypothetical protein FB451DRAFT_1395932 [Mycena latifolia]